MTASRISALEEALRELSDATLAAARVFNAMGKGEGCDLTEWARARQKMHDARLKANRLLSPVAGVGIPAASESDGSHCRRSMPGAEK